MQFAPPTPGVRGLAVHRAVSVQRRRAARREACSTRCSRRTTRRMRRRGERSPSMRTPTPSRRTARPITAASTSVSTSPGERSSAVGATLVSYTGRRRFSFLLILTGAVVIRVTWRIRVTRCAMVIILYQFVFWPNALISLASRYQELNC